METLHGSFCQSFHQSHHASQNKNQTIAASDKCLECNHGDRAMHSGSSSCVFTGQHHARSTRSKGYIQGGPKQIARSHAWLHNETGLEQLQTVLPLTNASTVITEIVQCTQARHLVSSQARAPSQQDGWPTRGALESRLCQSALVSRCGWKLYTGASVNRFTSLIMPHRTRIKPLLPLTNASNVITEIVQCTQARHLVSSQDSIMRAQHGVRATYKEDPSKSLDRMHGCTTKLDSNNFRPFCL